MSENSKIKKEHIGKSPYEIVFRGEKKTDKILLNIIDYNYDEIKEFDITSIEQVVPFKYNKNVSWFNLNGLHDEQLMTDISDLLEIPSYIISDIMNPSIRPKVQEFKDGLFITLKILEYEEKTKQIKIENYSLVFTGTLLLTFMEKTNDIFIPILERIINNRNKIQHLGTDYLAFSLLDIIIDNYIYITSLLGDKIESLEDKLIKDTSKDLLDKINTYKSEVNFLLKNIKPLREMFLFLNKQEDGFIHKENKIHYKELENNIIEVIDISNDYRDVLTDQFNIYHTMTSSKLNDIMKTLTVVSLIFSPLTFIAGIYGTNFKVFPEINWTYGYLYMWTLIIIIAIVMVIYFKKKKWF